MHTQATKATCKLFSLNNNVKSLHLKSTSIRIESRRKEGDPRYLRGTCETVEGKLDTCFHTYKQNYNFGKFDDGTGVPLNLMLTPPLL